MAKSLSGRVAIVTGASRGIGKAVAIELARHGANVAIIYRIAESNARMVCDEIESLQTDVPRTGKPAIMVPTDVSVRSDVSAMVKQVLSEYGKIDILVNNAGITRDRTMHRMSDEDWLTVMNTNLNGPFYCTTAVLPNMMERRYGRIINITTIPNSGNFAQVNFYTAGNGLVGMTMSAALELARYNIRVNAVGVGFVSSDMFLRFPDEIQEQIKQKLPIQRFGEPEEIASMVRYLAMEGDYITGQVICVDGGMSIA